MIYFPNHFAVNTGQLPKGEHHWYVKLWMDHLQTLSHVLHYDNKLLYYGMDRHHCQICITLSSGHNMNYL